MSYNNNIQRLARRKHLPRTKEVEGNQRQAYLLNCREALSPCVCSYASWKIIGSITFQGPGKRKLKVKSPTFPYVNTVSGVVHVYRWWTIYPLLSTNVYQQHESHTDEKSVCRLYPYMITFSNILVSYSIVQCPKIMGDFTYSSLSLFSLSDMTTDAFPVNTVVLFYVLSPIVRTMEYLAFLNWASFL